MPENESKREDLASIQVVVVASGFYSKHGLAEGGDISLPSLQVDHLRVIDKLDLPVFIVLVQLYV